MSQNHLDPHVTFRIEEVRDALRRRRFWRALLRMAAGLVGAALLFLAIQWVFLPIGWSRVLLVMLFWGTQAGIIYWYLIRRLRPPIDNAIAARMIDEHFPELQDRVTGMVEVGAREGKLTWMEEDFLQEARGTLVRSRFGSGWAFVAPARSRFPSILLLAFACLIWLVFPSLWQPWRGLNWGFGNAFTVEPGDVRVRLGDDQLVLLRSRHVGKQAVIHWRVDGEWNQSPMDAGDVEEVRFHQFTDIRQDLVYQVSLGNWRSPRYTIETWVPPEVLSIDLTYHYPDYLHMQPRVVPNSGPITALEGSRIVVRASVNKPLSQASMIFDSGRELVMERVDDLIWETSLIAEEEDIYRLELVDRNGDRGLFNPSYEIKIQRDKAPKVKINFPRRDMDVSPLDELAFKFSVSDDFGLQEYGLRYEVAGKEPVLIPLTGESGSALSAEGRHRLFLENMDLNPGDLLTWTVWAKDSKPNRDEYELMGAPYFLEVRPFKRQFREAISDQQGGGGPQGDNPIEKQKKLLIATWNLRRGANEMKDAEYSETHAVILEEQRQIREQVNGEGGGQPTGEEGKEQMKRLMSALDKAVEALQDATWPEPQQALSRAATAQQDAFQVMLEMEPEESRIQRSNQANASGGGSRDPDTDQLEIDRNRNFYEDERRTNEEQEAAKDALDKLGELARRQEMINEEINKLISELEEKETPEARRRLERLQEELRKNMEKLDEMQQDIARMEPERGRAAQQQLDQARERMDESLQNLEQQDLQGARTAGANAVNDLEELERELEKGARGTAEERVAGLRESIEELQQKQREIRQRVQDLQDEKDSPRLSAGDPANEGKALLNEEKEALAERFEELIEDAAGLSDLTRNSQEMLSRELGDWLRETSREGILEEIEETAEMVRYGIWSDLAEKEDALQRKLDRMADRFEKVESSMVSDEVEARERVVGQLRDLLNEEESIGQNQSSEVLRRFVEEDHKEWREQIEDASRMLGGFGGAPRELESVRREIDRFRKEYRESAQVPGGSAVIEAVVKPLSRAADQIERELQVLRKEREFLLRDEDSVPEQYRKSVSRYFEILSEAEVKRE